MCYGKTGTITVSGNIGCSCHELSKDNKIKIISNPMHLIIASQEMTVSKPQRHTNNLPNFIKDKCAHLLLVNLLHHPQLFIKIAYIMKIHFDFGVSFNFSLNIYRKLNIWAFELLLFG